MARPRYALIVLFALIVCAASGQTSLAPESGVLVLRNGQVIEGDVTRAGDYYVVTKGEGIELRLRADEVESFCSSLFEAYEFKLRHLSGESARPHIELAKWCLRHGLYAQCSEQLVAAMRLEPDNQQVKELETRLKLAVEATPPPSVAASTTSSISAEELEKAIRALPKASVEKFSAVVQPILLNRCGATNQCHGPNARSEFRLLRPLPGQIVSRRFTQRNLYAATRFLDSKNPEASPLVTMPQQRHGNSLAAIFDKHSAAQLAELVNWARLAIASPTTAAPAAPATITPTATTLSQPAAAAGAPAPGQSGSSPLTGNSPPKQPGATADVRVMRPPLDAPGSAPAASPPSGAPRDRFDPEIFNHWYHGK